MGLLSSLFGQQQPQAQTSMSQPQSRGLLGNLSDPAIALPLAGALMQPGGFGQNLGQGFAMAGQGMETRRKLQHEQLQQNMTAKYLEAQGADPSLVEMAKSGAGAQALQAWQQTREKPLDEIRLKTAQLQLEKLAKGDDGTPETFGLTPIYGQNDKKETVLGVVGSKGTFRPLNTPGFSPSTGVDKVDLGTQWGIVDRKTGLITQYIPKDVAGEASQTAQGRIAGETRGGALAALPVAKNAVDTAITQADQLINDDYLPNMVGPANARAPNITANAQRVQSKMNQLSGSAFLQARQALKGGGAITDMEGERAEAALVRANAAQSLEDYKAAIEEYKTHLRNGFAILEQQARGASVPSPQGGAGGGANDPLGIR